MSGQNDLKEWWDNRATQDMAPEELVASGSYRLSPAYENFIKKNIEQMLGRMKYRSLIIDAGCGVGLYIPLLLKYFDKVMGMDLSPRVLNRIPDSIKANPRVEIREGSLTSIPLEDASVQALFSKSTFQCMSLEDVIKASQEIQRVLNVNGEALIHIKNDFTIGYLIAYLKLLLTFRFSRAKRLLAQAQKFTLKENFVPGEIYFRHYKLYEKILLEAGFDIISTFSHQLYVWRYLEKIRSARVMEIVELIWSKIPLLNQVIKNKGINYYLLIRKRG